jgi:hypothetical protein
LEQLLSKTTNPDMQRAVKEVMGKLWEHYKALNNF